VNENKLNLNLAHLALKGIVIDFDKKIVNVRSDLSISQVTILINGCLPEDVRDLVMSYSFEKYSV